jgi:hypothetical protein
MSVSASPVRSFLQTFEQLWNEADLERLLAHAFAALHTMVGSGPARHLRGDERLQALREHRDFFCQIGLPRIRCLGHWVEPIQPPWLRLEVLWRFEGDDEARDATMQVRYHYVARNDANSLQLVISSSSNFRQSYTEYVQRRHHAGAPGAPA